MKAFNWILLAGRRIPLSSQALDGFVEEEFSFADVPFDFWPYEAEGCMNTKDLFLKKSSLFSKIKNSMKNGKICHIKTGRWVDYFTGETIDNAKDVIVAPVIPLKHIKKLGIKWGRQKTYDYVHDSEIFITLKKGGKGVELFNKNILSLKELPDLEPYRCEIIGMWLDAKTRWSISFKTGEKQKLGKLALSCLKQGVYNRLQFFGTWTKVEGQKCNTRTVVLRRDSLKNVTRENGYGNDECTSYLKGIWLDPYTDIKHTSTRDLDIDHLVPLKHAYVSGAWKWPRWKKSHYANFQVDPFHLLAVNLSENRSKGDKHPGLYMPPNERYHCQYIEQWIGIKFRWSLSIWKEEADFLNEEVGYCPAMDKSKYRKIIKMLSIKNSSSLVQSNN